MEKQLYIIAHIGSGGSNGKKMLDLLIENCNKKNISYILKVSEFKGHTIQLIEEMSNIIDTKFQRLIVIGGDGTLNEAVNGLKKINSDIPVAYLPAGTGNDFAREIGITKDVDKFLDSLLNLENPTNLEILELKDLKTNNTTCSINSVGFGIDALIVYLTSHSDKKKILKKLGLGSLSYFVYIFEAVKKHNNFNIQITKSDGQILEYKNVLIAAMMNHPFFGGGIKIDPLSSSNNNEIGIVIANNIKFMDLIKIVPRILFHGDHFEKYKKIFRISDNSFTIKIENPQYMQIDGETFGLSEYNLSIKLTSHNFWVCK